MTKAYPTPSDTRPDSFRPAHTHIPRLSSELRCRYTCTMKAPQTTRMPCRILYIQAFPAHNRKSAASSCFHRRNTFLQAARSFRCNRHPIQLGSCCSQNHGRESNPE